MRGAIDIQTAASSGAHIVTVPPPQILNKWVDHKYTRETVRQFVNDAQEAVAQMKMLKRS